MARFAPTGAVLMVANFPPDVGYAWWLMETYWAALAEQLHNAGRQSILAYPEPGPIPQLIAASPVEVIQLKFPRQGEGELQEFASFVRRRRVTSLYLTDRPLRDLRYARLRLAGVRRIVVHDHRPGDRPRIGGIKGFAKDFWTRLPGVSCDRAVAVTQFVRQRMIANSRFPAKRCVVVPNGIAQSVITGTLPIGLRDSLGISPTAILVAVVSRAHRYKNWSFGIEVAKAVLGSTTSDVHWIFCGDGPHLEEFISEAGAAGIAGQCHFLGRVSNVPAVLAECNIGFHPSLGEVGYSLSILEFMRAGMPVVVPDTPSVCGATEHFKTGLIFKASDPTAAREAFLRLINDSSLCTAMGAVARVVQASEFSLEASLKALRREVGDYL